MIRFSLEINKGFVHFFFIDLFFVVDSEVEACFGCCIYSSNPNNPSANGRFGLWGNLKRKDYCMKIDFWLEFQI